MSDAYCVPLYKSTRPDGTDFYTGSVDYAAALASGEPLPELSCGVAFPGPGWYHLATVPTECMGMSWPCRLFEVEPVGDVHRDDDHPYKVGCRSVRVLREVPAHEALGPQGEHVAVLIDRASRLTVDEIQRLDAAWVAARDAARVAARVAAWDAAWVAARVAARLAAWALITRDFITPEQYRVLVGPWASVCGWPHPDDAERYGETP